MKCNRVKPKLQVILFMLVLLLLLLLIIITTIPGHALHEKGLQRQIGVGTLVNSQQRRALAVPVINRG